MSKPLPVIEVFGPVIQGEGIMAGQQTIFVRFGGCDYRCSWCDSLHAVLPEEVKKNRTFMTVPEICEQVLELVDGAPTGYSITLSGGNPAMHNLTELVRELRMVGFVVACETQGTIWPDWFHDLDVLTLSPKPPSSGNVTEVTEAMGSVIQELIVGSQVDVCVKIVVFETDDLFYAKEAYQQLAFTDASFYLQPGTPTENLWLADIRNSILQRTQNVIDWLIADKSMPTARVLPQVHALLYGHEKLR